MKITKDHRCTEVAHATPGDPKDTADLPIWLAKDEEGQQIMVSMWSFSVKELLKMLIFRKKLLVGVYVQGSVDEHPTLALKVDD